VGRGVLEVPAWAPGACWATKRAAENYWPRPLLKADEGQNASAEIVLMIPAMSWLTFHRTVDVSQRSPSQSERLASRAPALGEVRHRHPTMAGLNVSPVHGRHCICDRCAREARNRD
jgi:hypothetical protein